MSKIVFKDYSKYYNLLYTDKNYTAEVEYIHSLIMEYSKNSKRILDLGCGTGKHDFMLAKKGYSITGIDMSESMINIAKRDNNYSKLNLEFQVGDIRNIKLNKMHDVVISLFHVASYQKTNSDILKYFRTAHSHLKNQGLFIFDFWYGPAVLTDRPQNRIKILEDKQIKVRRFTIPEIHPNKNVVNVKFDILIEDKQTKTMKEFTEIHEMRYFFLPELEYFLEQSGFSIINCYKWMTTSNLDLNSWYGTIIAKK